MKRANLFGLMRSLYPAERSMSICQMRYCGSGTRKIFPAGSRGGSDVEFSEELSANVPADILGRESPETMS